MDQESSEQSTWTQQDVIKVIPSIFLGVSSVFFILGLLIVNLHLAQYGIYSKEFLRTEYLLTGAVFVIFLILAEVSISYLVDWVVRIKAHWKERKFTLLIWSPLSLSFAALSVPIALLLLSGQSSVNLKALTSPLLGIFFTSMLFYTAIKQIKVNFMDTLSENKNINSRSEWFKRLSKFFGPLMLILFGITGYANTTYPYISAVYGGGDRAPAFVFPTQRGYEVCKALSLPINSNQTVGPLEVLTESEKELTILVQNGFSDKKVAIQLNKSLLDAIQTKSSHP